MPHEKGKMGHFTSRQVIKLENEVEKGGKGFGLSAEQEAELDEIIAKGLLTYAPWEEVKERILSKTKNDI